MSYTHLSNSCNGVKAYIWIAFSSVLETIQYNAKTVLYKANQKIIVSVGGREVVEIMFFFVKTDVKRELSMLNEK